MPIQSYRDLRVWRASMELAIEVYRVTSRFPSDERFGLTSQLRRAAVSVPSNIAEGHGRTHRGDFLRHLSMSRGSVMEIEVQLVLAECFSYSDPGELANARRLCDEISRMITRLKRSLGKTPESE